MDNTERNTQHGNMLADSHGLSAKGRTIPEIFRGRKYLDPVYNPAFQALLDDKVTLTDFLNSILHLEGKRQIDTLDYKIENPLRFRTPELKEIKFDIHAVTKDRRFVDVEIQKAMHPFFYDRAVLYSDYLSIHGKVKMEQSEKFRSLSDDEKRYKRYELPETISIWICNFDMPDIHDGYRDSWHLYSDEAVKCGGAVPIYDKKSYIFVDLVKYSRIRTRLQKEGKIPARTREDLWLHVLTNAGTASESMDLDDPIVEDALKRILVDNVNEDLIERQESSMVTQDEIDCRIAEGILKGRAKGIDEGRREGLREGAQSVLDMMLSLGVPEEKIAEARRRLDEKEK